MKNILLFISISSLFLGCSPKLKIYNQHMLMRDINIRKDNFYAKDMSNSNERLKGTWMWAKNLDTLIFKFSPVYKKRYDNVHKYKNSYYDTSEIQIKYVDNGKEVLNNIKTDSNNDCLYIFHFGIYTNMFYLYNRCSKEIGGSILMLVGNNGLQITSPNVAREKMLLEKEGNYKVVIPNSIMMKRNKSNLK